MYRWPRPPLAGLTLPGFAVCHWYTDDDLRPVVTTKKHVAQERIQSRA